MPEAGLCPGGAATCDPRENSQDEEQGLGANPRSQSVSNSRARAPGGPVLRAGVPLAKATWELLIECHGLGW